ncbi:LPP20 family lipoprotein [Psychromonas aquatilis]|uniref:LPP20 family lipoprotein n=1 Tax=Psychromonas aquatilis TaxID=2005072 RepID=A0ABU9GQ60_9GAMM
MKYVRLILPMLLASFVISGCSSSDSVARPEWIDHASEKYPSNIYLSAVGQGSTRDRASQKAIANLLEIFSVKVKSESRTLTEGIKKESALGVTLESSSTIRRSIATETEQAIQGAEIKESWLSPLGQYYVLAVIHRISAAQNLTESIIELDKSTANLIEYSNDGAPNSITALNALRSARDKQVTRKMADLQLSYLSGNGVPVEVSSEDIEYLIREKLASIEASVEAPTEPQRNLLAASLSRLGIKVVDSSPFKVVGTLDLTQPAYIESWYWLRGSYELTMTENDQVISRKRWPVKVSTRQKEMLNTRLQDKLDSHMDEYLQTLVSDTPSF